MSDAERAPGEMNFTVANVEALADCYRQLVEEHRSLMQSVSSGVERSLNLNEKGASFYEKLILLDGGTIALSLTFLGAFISRTPVIHLPRQSFLWLVCPAWLLLLGSILCCWRCITAFHIVNRKLHEQFIVLAADFHLRLMGAQIDRSSHLLRGELKLGALTFDLSQFISALGSSLTKIVSDQYAKYDALVKEAAESSRKMNRPARMATLPTALAFVLLCVFAVKVLLSV
jgi:hypothetical protein